MDGQRIGYVRVSTVEQNPARQLEHEQSDRCDSAARRHPLELLTRFLTRASVARDQGGCGRHGDELGDEREQSSDRKEDLAAGLDRVRVREPVQRPCRASADDEADPRDGDHE